MHKLDLSIETKNDFCQNMIKNKKPPIEFYNQRLICCFIYRLLKMDIFLLQSYSQQFVFLALSYLPSLL